MELQQIKDRIRAYLLRQKKAEGLQDDTELFKSKYINSLFALQIVMFLEKEFQIKLGRKEINERNFHTINAMAELVQRVRGDSHG